MASSLSALRRRRTRLLCYAGLGLVLALALAFGAATGGGVSAAGATTVDDGRWTASPGASAGETTSLDGEGTSDGNGSDGDAGVGTRNRTGVLVTVQSYGGFGENNGRAVLVQDGEVVWSFAPADSRVFDAEMLDNGNVLVSYATRLPAEECPERTLDYKPDRCVRNNVVEVDYDTKAVVWDHRWHDAFVDYHEVHDADRLPSGETAIVDMGNDRAFVVAENGSVVWEWSAREHMGPGSAFWERFGGPERPAPESDWTHMNDVDLTADGNFLLSIRNFDVVIEVNRSTKEILHVTGQPRETGTAVEGREPILDDQHNPMLVGNESHVVVADSEADRVVEVDRETGEVVWSYGEGLLWPRDADRLPNGNTLVTNSLRYEVLEVTPDGEVTWSYQVSRNGQRGIPYEADRVVLPEEASGMPSLGGGSSEAATTTATASDTGTATTEASGTSAASSTRTASGTASSSNGGAAASGDEGVVERYRGYALLYLPGWVGSVELWALLGAVVVGVVAAVDGAAYAIRRSWNAVVA